MKKLYKALLQIIDKWGCHHKWNDWKVSEIYGETIIGTRTEYPVSQIVHRECVKCGKLIRVTTGNVRKTLDHNYQRR